MVDRLTKHTASSQRKCRVRTRTTQKTTGKVTSNTKEPTIKAKSTGQSKTRTKKSKRGRKGNKSCKSKTQNTTADSGDIPSTSEAVLRLRRTLEQSQQLDLTQPTNFDVRNDEKHLDKAEDYDAKHGGSIRNQQHSAKISELCDEDKQKISTLISKVATLDHQVTEKEAVAKVYYTTMA